MENERASQPSPEQPSGSHPADSYDPATALADVDAARHSVADRLITPWWYHPALGAIVAAIVLMGALDLPNLVRLPIALACAAGIGLLVSAYQRVTGLWVDARNLGPTSRKWWLVYGVIAGMAVCASLIPLATGDAFPLWLSLLLAVVTVVATIVLGRRVDSTMRAEIRSGAATIPPTRR
ncbi:hypothetical protein [Dietzia sp. PP-33]|jgi:hypothetical protein|uniref:hypothetical protein n=1 Tax=Dietzia sp. PP-33 TaxID=2957500 RepID=UPI0029A79AAD|nr:hypothetical protein [Dietzia sp. PP-33]MDX2358070.1 hypothetical protein [Dietzia sp. PP-33]